ncbi:tetratricopeptide repeat protein [bacterium]|nr:tetratricopeptide repeat protein [bacterium]
MSDDRTQFAPPTPARTVATPPSESPADTGSTIPAARLTLHVPAGLPDVPGYRVTGEIGRGGMGRVLTATDLRFGRDVAVKVPLPGHAAGETGRLFVREAVITGRLAHPGIPPAHHLGELPDGTPFLAMKLVRGRTLADLLAARPDPGHDLPRFVGVVEQVCQAVGYAHAQGIVHRDLKPANVMVGAFGEVQVMDWGLAAAGAGTVLVGGGADGAPAPGTGVTGTPAYMAPEQARGGHVDARADVFALGGVLAAVLVGRPPFWAEDAHATLALAAAGDTTAVLAALGACPADPDLIGIARRCLAADPAARPADGVAVARLVEAYRRGVEDRLRAAERDRAAAEARAAEQRKRRRVQLALAAAVLVLVAGAGGVAVWRVREAADRRAEEVQRETEGREQRARAAAEDERREQAERDRKARATAAVAGLLDRAEAGLRAGAADRAGPFLDQAARRAADDGVTDHAARLAADRRDLAMLDELDRVDAYRWTPIGLRYPPPADVARRWAEAFTKYGVVPGAAPPVAVARIQSTPIRSALLAALDGWLARTPSAAVRDLLAAADPDPFRDEVRRRLAAADAAGLAALAGRPEWPAQPAGIVRAYAAVPGLPAGARRALLERVAGARPDDFGLAMDLGGTYPINDPATAAPRVRWFQAAVALRSRSAPARLSLGAALRGAGDRDGAVEAGREAVQLDPGSAAARNNLGNALAARGDLDGAVAEFREAMKLDRADAHPHHNLGNALVEQRDWPGAVAAYREAIRLGSTDAATRVGLGNALLMRRDADGSLAALREAVRLDPNDAAAHNGLGNVLRARGDPAGAAAAYREAIRLDPTTAPVYGNLGRVLQATGDFDGAVAAYREAIRREPENPAHHNGLGLVLEARLDLAGAEAAFREVMRLDPRSPFAPGNLGEVLRKQGRTAEAADAYRAALAARPDLRFAREGLAYCLRVLRGEVPTAPPPRPAGELAGGQGR